MEGALPAGGPAVENHNKSFEQAGCKMPAREERTGSYLGLDTTLLTASKQIPAAEASFSLPEKKLHDYCISHFDMVNASSEKLPRECPDWFKGYKDSIFVPLAKLYNQSVDGFSKPSFLNTVNAFSRTYNDTVVALMKLQIACEANAFTEAEKNTIAGWLDDTFECFPVSWRELPLVLSTHTPRRRFKESEQTLKPMLDANSVKYLNVSKREEFLPCWMNQTVNGLDLGAVYYVYYKLRNDSVSDGKSITSDELAQIEPALYSWLVKFQDEDGVLKGNSCSEAAYNAMKYRLSKTDDDIAAITKPVAGKRLLQEHKFKWTELEYRSDVCSSEDESDVDEDNRFSRSDSSGSSCSDVSVVLSPFHEEYDYSTDQDGELVATRKRQRSPTPDNNSDQNDEATKLLEPARKRQRSPTPDNNSDQNDETTKLLEPARKRQKVDSESEGVSFTPVETRPQVSAVASSGNALKKVEYQKEPDLISVDGTALIELGFTRETETCSELSAFSSSVKVGDTAIDPQKTYKLNGAQLFEVLESVLKNMIQPEATLADDEKLSLLKGVEKHLGLLSEGLVGYCLVLSNEAQKAGGLEAPVDVKCQSLHCTNALLEIARLLNVVEDCRSGAADTQLREYFGDARNQRMHEHIKAVFSSELRPDNWLRPLQSEGPKPFCISQEQWEGLSGDLQQCLSAITDKGARFDHVVTVKLLVEVLPGMLGKYSRQTSQEKRELVKRELTFWLELVDYLQSLNCRQHLSEQHYPNLDRLVVGSKTAYEGQTLSDDQVIWRHVLALLPLRKHLTTSAGGLKTHITRTDAGEIRRITGWLGKELVGSLAHKKNG